MNNRFALFGAKPSNDEYLLLVVHFICFYVLNRLSYHYVIFLIWILDNLMLYCVHGRTVVVRIYSSTLSVHSVPFSVNHTIFLISIKQDTTKTKTKLITYL